MCQGLRPPHCVECAESRSQKQEGQGPHPSIVVTSARESPTKHDIKRPVVTAESTSKQLHTIRSTVRVHVQDMRTAGGFDQQSAGNADWSLFQKSGNTAPSARVHAASRSYAEEHSRRSEQNRCCMTTGSRIDEQSGGVHAVVSHSSPIVTELDAVESADRSFMDRLPRCYGSASDVACCFARGHDQRRYSFAGSANRSG
jgi:hypothetical protein